MNRKKKEATIKRILEWVESDVTESIEASKEISGNEDDIEQYKQFKDDIEEIEPVIKAAPELLKALQNIVRDIKIGCRGESKEIRDQVEHGLKRNGVYSAIKKATNQ
jgi:hypothetical protein